MGAAPYTQGNRQGGRAQGDCNCNPDKLDGAVFLNLSLWHQDVQQYGVCDFSETPYGGPADASEGGFKKALEGGSMKSQEDGSTTAL